VVKSATGGSGEGLRYPALDALRGLAALAVVFHHIPANAGLSGAGWDVNFGRMVDLFFVISGFVIASAYGERLSTGFPLRRFLWLRWGRVWPLHATMLLVFLVALLALGALRPDLRNDGPLAGRQVLADLPAAFLLLNGFIPSIGMPWNNPSWSVSIEMALYGIAALAWRFLGRRAAPAALVASLIALAAAASPLAIDEAMYNMARGVAGFGLGMTLHAAFHRIPVRALPVMVATALEIATLFALGALLFGSGAIVPFDLVATGLVALAAAGHGFVSRVLLARPFQFLGALSYALYMVHVFVIGRVFDLLALVQPWLGVTVAASRMGAADALVGPDWQADLAKVVIMALCVGAAWPAAVLIERPARQWSRRTAPAVAASTESPN